MATARVRGGGKHAFEVRATTGDAVARTRHSADTVLTASEAVEAAASELRANVATFLKKVAV